MQIDVSDYEDWIGKTQEIEDKLEVSPLNRMAATLNERRREYSIGEKVPTLWHWLYFLNLPLQKNLGADGHEKRQGFMPPIPLPIRMYAGGEINFLNPLPLGKNATKSSKILSIQNKTGSSGKLTFLQIKHITEIKGIRWSILSSIYSIL